MKKIILLVFALISREIVAQEIDIKLVSETDGEPLAYRQALFKPSNFFTTSDFKGILKIERDLFLLQESIIISGFGLNDTTVFISDLSDRQLIKLSLRDLVLPKIEIEKRRLKAIQIGSKDYPIQEIDRPIKAFNNPNGTDYKYAILVNLPKNKEKFISEVNFFVSNILGSNSEEINFRVLAPLTLRKLKEGKIFPSNDFVDVASEPIHIKINSAGWNKITFPNGIYIPKETEQVFLIFDIGRESDFFALPYQKGSSFSIQHGFYFPPGEIGVFNKSTEYPAVFVELLID